ncbi:NTP-binding protein [Klebsiella pneumoniae subsp. pneumoniae]|nr:NTP-binding protein [Klebsiella pneumoniae subsp. pneumoniae]OXU97647.1 NTP-binding protein [Klebsiella pneumoniae subsp. pneumoniae]OYE40747.1 NTP-binding protein [Klebsiella pneumoniae subsp. pneumoniae]OYE66727.1 NTP-binding protein [Klebsiella pneumoniae subsp. pneumoniae]OYF08920.1 NTP-binding protein [Klebsiella pneumoniae subsp. pneumoniae]
MELSGAGCTTAITPNQLVQSSSENDTHYKFCKPKHFYHYR